MLQNERNQGTRTAARRTASFAVAAIAGVLLLTSCMTNDENHGLTVLNAHRNHHAATPVGSNEDLVLKAQNWSKQMLANSGGRCASGTLAHSNLQDGAPAGWTKLGENVACRVYRGGEDYIYAIQVQFMNSPGHRANVLDGTFTHAGIGIATMQIGDNLFVAYETQVYARF